MDTRSTIGILLIVYALQMVVCAPSTPTFNPIPTGQTTGFALRLRVRRTEERETGRIFWSAVGDILETLPFLPFTFNVPDFVSGVWNFFTGFFPGSANKRPKKNATETIPTDAPITRQDIIDYFFYDD